MREEIIKQENKGKKLKFDSYYICITKITRLFASFVKF